MSAPDLGIQIRLEMQTAQGESALKRFEAAVHAALRRLGRSEAEIGVIKQLAAEVDAGKKKLAELPQQYRRDVAELARIGRGVKLLDEVNITRSHAQVRTEIDRLRQSFKDLKAAAVLPRAELEQAAQRTRTAMRALGEEIFVDTHSSPRVVSETATEFRFPINLIPHVVAAGLDVAGGFFELRDGATPVFTSKRVPFLDTGRSGWNPATGQWEFYGFVASPHQSELFDTWRPAA